MKIATTERQLRKQLTDLWTSENEIKWTRAAITYAFLESGRVDNATVFAAMKIKGLGASNTVRSYYLAWAAAVEMGFAKHVEPGSELTIPTLDFSDFWNQTPAGRANAKRREATAQKNTTPSIQGERDTTSAPKPPRSASARENVENAIRSIEVALRKETDDVRSKQLEIALYALKNTLEIYKKAVR